jgi:GWxTD domain-containing protein
MSQETLTAEQSRWLEDVSPIMTKTEREVFLALKTNRERERFIGLFWRTRDPQPDTSDNEFQREYLQRVAFADQNFGHGTSRRGNQTERGYFYLLLGPPLERSQYTTQSQLVPLELWFYKGQVEYGLPDYFYLIFYQPQGMGEFRLYDPGTEGPETLVIPLNAAQRMTRRAAYQIMRKFNAELASAALSYLPGEQPTSLASFSSNAIIASIREFPAKKFRDSYARAYLASKDYIETEYADNFLASVLQVKLFEHGGQPFVHWSLEPEKMNFAVSGDTAYAGFELVLKMEDRQGHSLFEKVDEVPLKLSFEQYKAHERQRFAFQDILPVIPGEHRLIFLLKNKTGKDFSSSETKILVPGRGQPGFSSLLLHHGRTPVPETQKSNLKAFVINGMQFLVGTRNEFLAAEKMGIFIQAFHPEKLLPSGRPRFMLEIFAADSDKSLIQKELSAEPGEEEDPRTLAVEGTADLAPLKPGYYRAEVAALTPEGRRLLVQKDQFIVLAQAFPVMPWSYARLHGRFPGADDLRTLGTEFFLAQEYEAAMNALRQALAIKDEAGTRLLLAKALLALGRFRESLDQALPVFEKVPGREAAKVMALDYAGLKDWASSLVYLEKLMAEATEVSVLNLAAECHLNLGHPEMALPLLQKSLSLLPDQPSIKDLEQKIRKRLGQ